MKDKIVAFEASLTKQKLTQIRLMTFALCLGPLLFAVVAIFLNFSREAGAKPPLEIFSFINMALMSIVLIASSLLPGLIMRSKARFFVEKNDFERIFFRMQMAHIMKLALLEGAALFGGVTLILGSPLWNLVSLLPLLYVGICQFPSTKSLVKNFIVYFLQDERHLIEYE